MTEEIKIKQKAITYILIILVIFFALTSFVLYRGFTIEDKQHAELIEDYNELIEKYNYCISLIEYYSDEIIVQEVTQNQGLNILDILKIFS